MQRGDPVFGEYPSAEARVTAVGDLWQLERKARAGQHSVRASLPSSRERSREAALPGPFSRRPCMPTRAACPGTGSEVGGSHPGPESGVTTRCRSAMRRLIKR